MVEEDKIDGSKYKSIKKNRNKIVKILAKSKSRNLYKPRFESLFRSK